MNIRVASSLDTKQIELYVPGANRKSIIFGVALALLLGIVLYISISSAYLQFISTSPAPYYDQWSTVIEYGRLAAGHFKIRDWFSQSNEHRLLFPRLFMYADMAFFNGLNLFDVVMSDLFQIGSAYIIYVSLVPEKVSTARKIIATCLIGSCLLNAAQYENMNCGFQVQFVMVYTFALASFCFALQSGGMAIAGSIACAIVSTYSMANGMLVWPLLVAAMAVQRRRRAATVIFVAGALAIGLYLRGYQTVADHTPLSAVLAEPSAAVSYFLTYLGGLPAPRKPEAARIFGAVLLVLLAGTAVLKRREPDDAFTWCVVLFVLGSALLTTVGRFHFGDIQALSPRYLTPDGILWAVTGCIALRPVINRITVRISIVFLSLMIISIALYNQHVGSFYMHEHADRMARGASALVSGNFDGKEILELGLSRDQMRQGQRILQQHCLSVFAPCAP